MKTYETVIILDDRKVDDGGVAFIDKVAEMIESMGGTIKEKTSMGRKQFARPIKKHRAGTYWDIVMDMDEEKVAEFKSKYRLEATVLRLQVFSYIQPPVTTRRAASSNEE